MNKVKNCHVSVVLSCFNSERTIREALDSVLAQTLADIEIVVADGGSGDRTSEILAEYAEDLPGRVIRVEGRREDPYQARHHAARHALGTYLAFLDSDDTWFPDKLEKQVELMEAWPQVALCHTGGLLVDERGRPVRMFRVHPDYHGRCLRALVVENRIATSSVLIRRGVFESLDGLDGNLAASDWELWTRASIFGDIAALDECLIRYREYPIRSRAETERMREHHLQVIERHQTLYRDRLPDLDRTIRESRFLAHIGFASEYFGAGEYDRARRDAILALRQRPGAMRAWGLLAKTMFGSGPIRPAGRQAPERNLTEPWNANDGPSFRRLRQRV